MSFLDYHLLRVPLLMIQEGIPLSS